MPWGAFPCGTWGQDEPPLPSPTRLLRGGSSRAARGSPCVVGVPRRERINLCWTIPARSERHLLALFPLTYAACLVLG